MRLGDSDRKVGDDNMMENLASTLNDCGGKIAPNYPVTVIN